MEKIELLGHLKKLLKEKIEGSEALIASTRASRNNDTKSSAGDKHEVGRAMIQQELDKQEGQLQSLKALQDDLFRVPLDRKFDQAGFGSLVTTDHGSYFIAIGLGPVEMKGEVRYAVSPASPIGQLLKNKRVGDQVIFNGRKITIERIT